MTRFVEVIESRVASGDYDDPRRGIGLPEEILGMSGSVDEAERIVASSEMKKLFSWNP